MEDQTQSTTEGLRGAAGDAAIQKLGAGNGDASRYDFRQALHLSKDQLRVVTRTHEQFVRWFVNELTLRLRIPVQIQVQDAVEVTYEQFINELAPVTVIQVVDLNSLDGRILLQFDTNLVFSMLDHFMGGSSKKKYMERELTELETLLFQSLITQFCPLYSRAWSPFCEFTATFGALENHPRFVQVAAPSDSVLKVRLACRMEQYSTMIHVLIPYILLEKMVPKLKARQLDVGRASPQRDKRYRDLVSQHLLKSDARVSVQIGDILLNVGQVMDLQVGDVIPLSHPVDIPVPLYVNGTPIGSGTLGTSHGNYATKVVELSNIAETWKESVETDD